jgi:hypothetical protein
MFGSTDVCLCHMPHSLASLHAIYPDGCFDDYDALFAAGPHHAEEFSAIRKQKALPSAKVFSVGYGKFDLLPKPIPQRGPADLPTVLLAPSWGENNLLNTIGPAVIRELVAMGLKVVLRPHPAFLVNGEPALAAVLAEFGGHSSFALESSGDVGQAFFSADVMVSDYSGIALEFAAIRHRPVIFVDLPRKVLNPNWADLGLEPVEVSLRQRLGCVVVPDPDAVRAAVEKQLKNAASLVASLPAVVNQFAYQRESVAAEAELAVRTLWEESR